MLGKKLRFLECLHEIRDPFRVLVLLLTVKRTWHWDLLTMHTVLLILSHGHHWHDK